MLCVIAHSSCCLRNLTVVFLHCTDVSEPHNDFHTLQLFLHLTYCSCNLPIAGRRLSMNCVKCMSAIWCWKCSRSAKSGAWWEVSHVLLMLSYRQLLLCAWYEQLIPEALITATSLPIDFVVLPGQPAGGATYGNEEDCMHILDCYVMEVGMQDFSSKAATDMVIAFAPPCAATFAHCQRHVCIMYC